ncbi:hypothetical protein D187_009197 [Cystobacter fuscus DSM 2262]|uniref:Uncharacterized protein n=1 Tax=Cystobacter fuscus (strain ATCC 25194 / DSM 2262 / NBRC 100088 / M29) TaxID=1242864 RepID=S9NXJ5_CYSF2|nr:hypothetical protein D187_009197 [Cystobacter fuscus DSM 2262]
MGIQPDLPPPHPGPGARLGDRHPPGAGARVRGRSADGRQPGPDGRARLRGRGTDGRRDAARLRHRGHGLRGERGGGAPGGPHRRPGAGPGHRAALPRGRGGGLASPRGCSRPCSSWWARRSRRSPSGSTTRAPP